MDGLLVIDKPEGPTSHDVVARVRRIFKLSRVGHTGTLDPMASGVLPLVLGRATRLARFLTSDAKRYEAVVSLGQATDTYDRTGQPIGEPAAEILPRRDDKDFEFFPESLSSRREYIESALARFRGTFEQTPPPYSAKKIGGVTAYRLARRGEAVTPAPVTVNVSRLDLRDVSDTARTLTLELQCSAGFYVRSLAHDLGATLGCGGHLSALRRTASGEWTLAHAIPLDAVERDPEAARARLIPMSGLLAWMAGVRLTDEGVTRVRHGQPVRPVDVARHEGTLQGEYIRLLAPDGGLLALAEAKANGILHPALVLV